MHMWPERRPLLEAAVRIRWTATKSQINTDYADLVHDVCFIAEVSLEGEGISIQYSVTLVMTTKKHSGNEIASKCVGDTPVLIDAGNCW